MFKIFQNISVKTALVLFVFLSQFKVYSQVKADKSKRLHYLFIPIIFNTPETGISFGLTNSIFFKTTSLKDTSIRMSAIQTIGFFTTKKQNVQAVDASIYFPKEKYILLVQFSHSYFPDKFWGIGASTPDSNLERYAFEQFFINPHLKRKISKHLFFGSMYEFQRVYNIYYEEGGEFEASNFYGKTNHTVSGAGLSIAFDTRSHAFWPEKGVFLQSFFTGFKKELFLSDYNFGKLVTDLRYFRKIYKKQVLAFQFYNYKTFGQTPLRQLAEFGGSNNMRGFYQGRYRENNMFSFITEYRAVIKGRFGAVLFGGMGNVYNNFSDLVQNDLKVSFGGGLRFALLKKEKLNIRLDFGYANKNNMGLYFTVGECF